MNMYLKLFANCIGMHVKFFWIFIKCSLGLASFEKGEICWMSTQGFDFHDYPTSKGGDGTPAHFHFYTCHKCGCKFTI